MDSAPDFNRRRIRAVCYGCFLKGKLTAYWKKRIWKAQTCSFLAKKPYRLCHCIYFNLVSIMSFFCFPPLPTSSSQALRQDWAANPGNCSDPSKMIKQRVIHAVIYILLIYSCQLLIWGSPSNSDYFCRVSILIKVMQSFFFFSFFSIPPTRTPWGSILNPDLQMPELFPCSQIPEGQTHRHGPGLFTGQLVRSSSLTHFSIKG